MFLIYEMKCADETTRPILSIELRYGELKVGLK